MTLAFLVGDLAVLASRASPPILGTISMLQAQSGREGPAGTATPSVFTVQRSGDLGGSLSLRYQLSGSAVPGIDYSLAGTDYDAVLGYGTFFFAAGAATATLSLASLDNEIRNSSRTIVVSLLPASGYSLNPGASSAAASLIDDDEGGVPVISVAINLSLAEKSGANWQQNLTLTLSRTTTVAVVVHYSFGDRPAQAEDPAIAATASNGGDNADYIATDGTLTIAAGSLQGSIPFLVVADASIEDDEFFYINLSLAEASVAAATFSGGASSFSARVTLLNDDQEEGADPNAGITLSLGEPGTLTGTDLNDILIGSYGKDTIGAGDGDDTLIGNGGDDRLTGGLGADRYVYLSFSDSTKASHDTIVGLFYNTQGDRIALGPAIPMPPKLWYVGLITAPSLDDALANAYADVDRTTSGNTPLGAGEALSFLWGATLASRSTYFIVDDGQPGTDGNLLIRTTGNSISTIGEVDPSLIFVPYSG